MQPIIVSAEVGIDVIARMLCEVRKSGQGELLFHFIAFSVGFHLHISGSA